MAIGYHINNDDGLITIRADGAFAPGELRSTGERLLADRRFDPSLPQLIDLRALHLAPGQIELRAALGLLDFVQKEYRQAVRATVAVVVDPELDSSTFATCYRITAALERAELFDDYEHALRWLMLRAFAAPQATGPRHSG